MKQPKGIIGRNVAIEFTGHAKNIPAKVDTGADSSSVWASNFHINQDGQLSFTLFGEKSQYYTAEVITRNRKQFSVGRVRSSSGHEQIRYRTQLTIMIHDRQIRAVFNLSDRSLNAFPVLIGRRTLAKKFIVDVTKSEFEEPSRPIVGQLDDELQKDPYKFHKKYHIN